MSENSERPKPSYYVDSAFYHAVGKPDDIRHTEIIPTRDGEAPLVIHHWEPFTIDSLCGYYGIGVSEIGPAFEAVSLNIARDAQNYAISKAPDINPVILLHLWQALQTAGEVPEDLRVVADAMRTFPDYMAYLQTLDIPLNGHQKTDIATKFRETAIRYQSLKYCQTVPGFPINMVTDGAPGQWIYLGRNRYGVDEAARVDVVEIARQYAADSGLVRSVSAQPGGRVKDKYLFHDTTDLAGVRVLKSRAILSAWELERRNIRIVSGEFTEDQNSKDTRHDVYASSRGVTTGNSNPSFFGEETVTFIIRERMQEETMRAFLSRKNSMTPEEVQFYIDKYLRRLPSAEVLTEAAVKANPKKARAMALEIIRKNRKADPVFTSQNYESFLGPEVPMQNVPILAVPLDHVREFEDLVREQGLNIRVIVREAAQLVNLRRDLFF